MKPSSHDSLIQLLFQILRPACITISQISQIRFATLTFHITYCLAECLLIKRCRSVIIHQRSCLPIFSLQNSFSCSNHFNKAIFLVAGTNVEALQGSVERPEIHASKTKDVHKPRWSTHLGSPSGYQRPVELIICRQTMSDDKRLFR